MSDPKKAAGAILWMDLTVPDAEATRGFYEAVVGWTHSEVDMGGYHDFCMNKPDDGQTVAGICHARGENADLPPQWLIYINVTDLTRSIEQCEKLGGKVLHGPRDMGGSRCAVIQDPAGAVAALFEPGAD